MIQCASIDALLFLISMNKDESVFVQTPKVSVLMPVFNTQESHLREAIESILSQSYADFEFLILNDASTDANVEKVVKSYDDSRIIYSVNEKNLGISASRNKLIEMACGEYLAVVDHDDVSHPARFFEEVSYLDKHPETGLVSSIMGSVGNEENKVWDVPEQSLDIKKLLLVQCCFYHPACMIRKSVLVDNDVCYEPLFSPSEDHALFCRLINKTEFYNIQKVLLYYRNHSGNTTHLKAREMTNATFAVLEFARRENPELWDYVRFNLFRKHRVVLFKFLRFIKIEEYSNRMDFYLFSIIPIFSLTTDWWRKK